MYFERSILEQLRQWRASKARKPLLLLGARQVGKTTVLKEFGKEFSDILYLNFEHQKQLQKVFELDLDVKRILSELALILGKKIEPEKTLIIFDEIQECRQAITSFKYFQEDAPGYCIVGAGSLLGVNLGHQASFPVGKVDFLNMHPLSFREYLKSSDQTLFEAYLHCLDQDGIQSLPEILLEKIMFQFKLFLISGGMPEPATLISQSQDFARATEKQFNIVNAYKADFAKHTSGTIAMRLGYLWDSIPSQLARENKKFVYKAIKKGARAREYELALEWLQQAGLVHKVFKVSKPGMPISAFADLSAFKLYLLDTGLLGAISDLYPQAYLSSNRIFEEFKGALTENYICQSLRLADNKTPWYWTSQNAAEVDFLVQYKQFIIPIEVKSNLAVRSKSLAYYGQKYDPVIKLRFSARNLKLDDDLLNIPLFYAADYKMLLGKII